MSSLSRKAHRALRIARLVAWGALHSYHPLQVQIVPMRRCNLSCSYCNEYDKTSEPVPLRTMLERIDHLARLGTASITISGGEPMLHPHLDAMLARIRRRHMVAGLITNGFLLGPERIERLNDAGLDVLQISIDNVEPDAVSRKSLKTLERKLEHLAELAEFDVVINSVLGAGTPDDARTVARRAQALGFKTSVGLLHDGQGRLKPLAGRALAVYEELQAMGGSWLSAISGFQRNLAAGQPNDWHCRAGARYLYVCEEGLVHHCSQQRGRPGIPLQRYGMDDIRREFHAPKACAPYCTINCVHRACYLDGWRRPLESAGLGRWLGGGDDPLGTPSPQPAG